MQVFAYLRWRKKDKQLHSPTSSTHRHSPVSKPPHNNASSRRRTRSVGDEGDDSDWDFGARQTPDSTTQPLPTQNNLVSRPFASRSQVSLTSSPASSSTNRVPVVGTVPPRLSSLPSGRNRHLQDPLAEWPPRGHPVHNDHPPSRHVSANAHSKTISSVRQSGPEDLHNINISAGNASHFGGAAPAFPEEGDVLVAAATSARESRDSKILDDRRRRALSLAPDRPARPLLRHAYSAHNTRELFEDVPEPTETLPKIPDRLRRTLLSSKRSMPELEGVWENFLEETSEDAQTLSVDDNHSFSPRKETRRMDARKSVDDLDKFSFGRSYRPDIPHPPLPRHLPTLSSSSMISTSSAASSKLSPALSSAELVEHLDYSSLPATPSSALHRRGRVRGHGRASHQTGSSSSHTGSTSSLAFSFSSASSMTTVYDESEDELLLVQGDDRSDRTSPATVCSTPANDGRRTPPHLRSKFSPASNHSFASQSMYNIASNSPSSHSIVSSSTSVATTSLPSTPSRGLVGQSSPTSILKRPGRPSPTCYFSPTHSPTPPVSQWQRSSEINPVDLPKIDAPYTSLNSATTVVTSLPSGLVKDEKRVPRGSQGSSGENDFSSELDYYYYNPPPSPSPTGPIRRHAPPPSRLPPGPPQPVTPPLSRPSFHGRSKSTPDVCQDDKSAVFSVYEQDPRAYPVQHSGDDRYPRAQNQLHLMVIPPPTPGAGAVTQSHSEALRARLRTDFARPMRRRMHSDGDVSIADVKDHFPLPPSSTNSSPVHRILKIDEEGNGRYASGSSAYHHQFSSAHSSPARRMPQLPDSRDTSPSPRGFRRDLFPADRHGEPDTASTSNMSSMSVSSSASPSSGNLPPIRPLQVRKGSGSGGPSSLATTPSGRPPPLTLNGRPLDTVHWGYAL